MKILAVDIGTGTQDIVLFDSALDVENSYKLVLPAPTMIVRRRIQQATAQRRPILLTGATMGGGPSQWAAEDHVKAGLEVYATANAALSFNDDLSAVEEMGIQVVSDVEAAAGLPDALRIHLCDYDEDAIRTAFGAFGVSLDDLDAVFVAVFDHGAAPLNVSDRAFRFEYIDAQIRARNTLTTFAFSAANVPPIMTRLRAVANTHRRTQCPLILMDTAPAAILGATLDPRVAAMERCIVVNIGNFHTLAFRLNAMEIEGVFEHHTGLVDQPKLEWLIEKLADGSLSNADVFDDHGHGALIYTEPPLKMDLNERLVVTGPRRSLLRDSSLKPYFAAPFGDMMTAGCYGLLTAAAELLPQGEQILSVLHASKGMEKAPWD